MITAFKALCRAVSWGLKGVLGLLRQRGSLDWAVDRAVRETEAEAVIEAVYRATDWNVRRAVSWAVWRAVWRAVYVAEAEAVIEAVDRVVWNDPEHPALQDFLRSAGAGVGARRT